MKQLPKYYAIKRDENNPLWNEYIQWLNHTFLPDWGYDGTMNQYYGYDGNDDDSDCGTFRTDFSNIPEIITLEQWAEATRGNGLEPEFDPSKPFEVSADNKKWSYGSRPYKYVGVTSKGIHAVEIENGNIVVFNYIRNIELFNASMLEVGEYMETKEGLDGKRNLLTRVDNADYFIDMNNAQNGQFSLSVYDQRQIKGRRVDVKLIVEEV